MNINLEEFKKSELRVGKVLKAERVEGSEKLLRLEIDLGEVDDAADSSESSKVSRPRQILSGIGKAYEPDELVDKFVVIIANLEPRMMMGLESRGMLLAVTGQDGKPKILTIDGDIIPGSLVT